MPVFWIRHAQLQHALPYKAALTMAHRWKYILIKASFSASHFSSSCNKTELEESLLSSQTLPWHSLQHDASIIVGYGLVMPDSETFLVFVCGTSSWKVGKFDLQVMIFLILHNPGNFTHSASACTTTNHKVHKINFALFWKFMTNNYHV